MVVRAGGMAGLVAVVLALGGGVLTDAQPSTLGAILAALPLLLLVLWLAAIRAFQATTLGRLGSAGAWASMLLGAARRLGVPGASSCCCVSWAASATCGCPPAGRLIDFFNIVKSPPSLTFLLLSLGVDLVLWVCSRMPRWWLSTTARPLVTLGQAALYFFVAHWFVYAVMGGAFFPTPGGLPATYLVWIVGLAVLYPICKAYEAFKHRMPAASVWRMYLAEATCAGPLLVLEAQSDGH